MPDKVDAPKLKALKVFVAAVELHCPECVKEIPTPEGSLFWVMYELPEHVVGCPSEVRYAITL